MARFCQSGEDVGFCNKEQTKPAKAEAVCYRAFRNISDADVQYAVTLSERFADGLVTEAELVLKRQALRNASYTGVRSNYGFHCLETAIRLCSAFDWEYEFVSVICHAARFIGKKQAGKSVQASIIRDIFGRLLFRPAALDLVWLTSTVKQLAVGIYEDRAFDQLPILADALEEAGCTDADILNHCRQPGQHKRGCWVLDLLLGRD